MADEIDEIGSLAISASIDMQMKAGENISLKAAFAFAREALLAHGYRIEPDPAALLRRGREAGIVLIDPLDKKISEETKQALANIDKDTKYGL